jgi:hypothetical protein
MQIAEGIETGQDYYWKRSGGWKGADGVSERYWEFYIEFSGFNGAGGLWLVEKTRHNGQSSYPNGKSWFSIQPRTLSRQESLQIVREVQKHLGIALTEETQD